MVADYTWVQGALDEGFGGRAVAQGCVLTGEEGAVSTEARLVICVLGCHCFTFKNKRSAWSGKGTSIYLSRPRRLIKSFQKFLHMKQPYEVLCLGSHLAGGQVRDNSFNL